jgi:hypothetical protein
MTSKFEEMPGAFKRKILRRICGPKKVDRGWMMRYNTEIYDLYKEVEMSDVKLRRLQWVGHVI